LAPTHISPQQYQLECDARHEPGRNPGRRPPGP
jgi:hypothetical protein